MGVELANRESRSSWRDFLLGLRERGLAGVEFVVADDHAGLKRAIREVLPEAAYQRCYVGLLKNASLPRAGGPAEPELVTGRRGKVDRRARARGWRVVPGSSPKTIKRARRQAASG